MNSGAELATWKHEVETKIRKMISDWERRFPADEDDTLYTLALRRALDVVQGQDPDLGP